MQPSKIITALILVFFFFQGTAQTSVPLFGKRLKVPTSDMPLSFNVQLRADNDAALILHLDNPGGGALSLQIRQKGIGPVLDTVVREASYGARYHFDNSVDGSYEVVVRKGKECWRRTLRLTTQQTVTRSIALQ